jgi:hypothetical protein
MVNCFYSYIIASLSMSYGLRVVPNQKKNAIYGDLIIFIYCSIIVLRVHCDIYKSSYNIS